VVLHLQNLLLKSLLLKNLPLKNPLPKSLPLKNQQWLLRLKFSHGGQVAVKPLASMR
jgi:hypothetical protein